MSATNDLTVNVALGASVGVEVLLGDGGTAMNLTGNNVTLNNNGVIDPSLLGLRFLLSSGTSIGNAAASTVNVTNANTGTMNGTTGLLGGDLSNLTGMALTVQNGTGGVTNITNSGSLGSSALLGITLIPSDAPVLAVYGGGQVNVVNTGTITGRVAFQASGTPGTGNTFVNAGTISGSVSMGAGSVNSFTAVTGSTVSAGDSLGLNVLDVLDFNLGFAPTGVIDGGVGGNNTLLLQNAATGTGSGTTGTGTIASGTYIDFQHLKLNSGTWTLTGSLGLTDFTLNGGVAVFDNSGAFGTGGITAGGGAIQASTGGLNVANNVELQAGGLTVQGTNALTLSGGISGTGGLIKNGSGTLTATAANTYSGGTALNAGSLVVGNGQALGTGLLTVGGAASLDSTVPMMLANNVNINNASVLTLAGSNALNLSGTIAGVGALVKNGAATLTLGAAETYTGGTTINAGTLKLGAGGSLSATGALNIGGGGTGFDISASGNQTVGSLAGASGSTVSLGANTLTLGDASSQTFAG
ncbi:autotransporter-associated beta strand repeat-containing protein, partial [Paraburkholderia sediminicola]